MTDWSEHNPPAEEPKSPTPPIKRILAWVGVIYMVCLVLLNLYPFFHQGSYLTGVAPLFACPGIGGLFAMSICLLRSPDSSYSRKASMGVLAGICAVLFVVSLYLGLPALLSSLGGGT